MSADKTKFTGGSNYKNAFLTLSIVTYNSENVIRTLMDSIYLVDDFEDLSVYVIDNASTDNTVSIIKKSYPWVHLYESEINQGFGKAHNIAINHVNSKYHIIVNPDIQVNKDTFKKCVEYLDANEDVVVVTPLVLNMDGSQQHLPKRNPSIKYLLGGMFEKHSSLARNIRDEYTMKNESITGPAMVEFCSGCFMITRTAALHEVGGFDERYFLHFEDADLTRELRKVGKAVYNPGIVVTHRWQRENRKLNKSLFAAFKSMQLYLKKWRRDHA